MSQCIRRLLSKTRSRRVFPVGSGTTNTNRLSRRFLHQEHASTPVDVDVNVDSSIQDQDVPWEIPRIQNPDRQPELDAQEELLEIISFLLRHHAGKDHGLPSRPDGYLSIQKLLTYPMFQNVDIGHLQNLVNNDKKFRFEIKFEPARLGGPWWLRLKPWDENFRVFKPAILSQANGIGVYKTSLTEWKSYISKTGIARLDQDYIRLIPHAMNKNYIESFDNEPQVIIFLDISFCIASGFRFYYEVFSSQVREVASSPILTRGNDFGIIPPSFFKRVKVVNASRIHLWGVNEPFPIRQTPIDPTMYDEHGRRKTYLNILERNLHGFVDFYGENDLKKRPIHPDTLKEAEEVVDVM